MIEAGFQVLCRSGITDECLDGADRLLVADIYRAMVDTRKPTDASNSSTSSWI
jgi:hypothetical protein